MDYVAEKILNLMRERNCSVYRLAKGTDLSSNTIYNWFRQEKYTCPSLESIDKVCSFFKINRAELLAENKKAVILDECECQLLILIRGLSREQRRYLLKVLKNIE